MNTDDLVKVVLVNQATIMAALATLVSSEMRDVLIGAAEDIQKAMADPVNDRSTG